MAKKRQKKPTVVQTLIFSKEKFAKAEDAKAWATEHDFRSDKIDETEDSWRLRQRNPEDFEPGSFKTIELDEGVQATIGHLKDGMKMAEPGWRREGERLERTIALRAEDIDEAERSVSVSFSSETDEIRFGGLPEILVHERETVNLKKLSDIGAVLFNHNPDTIIGRPENVRIDKDERKGRAEVIFDDDPESERIWKKVRSGSLRGVSVGFRVEKWVELEPEGLWTSPEGRNFLGPAFLAVKWRPIEFSLTPIPADGTVGVGRTAEDSLAGMLPEAEQVQIRAGERQEVHVHMPELTKTAVRLELEALGLRPEASEEEALEFVRGLKAANQAEATAEIEATGLAERQGESELRRQDEAGIRQERERQKTIRDLCSRHPAAKEILPDLLDQGVPVEQARTRILDAVLADRPMIDTRTRVDMGEEERSKWSQAASDRILLRVGRLRDLNKDHLVRREEAARQVEGDTLLELLKESLKRSGLWKIGLSRDQLIERAITQTSSMYPGILGDSARKVLLQGWSEAPSTYEPLVSFRNAQDFKTLQSLKLGDMGNLELTPELVPMPESALAEVKETYSIATYAKRFGISRQALINDDLSAFDRIPSLMGAAARRVPNKLFWDLLTSGTANNGPTMAEDSLQLFSDTHASGDNLHDPSGAEKPTVATVGAGYAVLRKQKGLVPTGEAAAPPLNITPGFLVVPAILEMDAMQFAASIVDPSKSNATPNPFAGKLQVIAEPLLDAISATAWYLSAAPNVIITAEAAFLGGQREPNMVRVEGTNVLGVEWGVYLDCGLKFVDHRGWYRNLGA